MDLSSKQKKTLVDVAEEFLLLQFSVLVESVALYSFVSCFFWLSSKRTLVLLVTVLMYDMLL